mmetsp:Transcript_8364/g.16421  ORF Transcript_8364/g.16421 Transcript_8364/m.16421 type:complete len:92 (-) Transcript_8364:26-301(-)
MLLRIDTKRNSSNRPPYLDCVSGPNIIEEHRKMDNKNIDINSLVNSLDMVTQGFSSELLGGSPASTRLESVDYRGLHPIECLDRRKSEKKQ